MVERELPIRHLPASLVGQRLIQVSDLHIGSVVDDDYLVGAVEKINHLKPDILVCTGDWMSCHGHEQIEHVMKIIKPLQLGRLATISILGNHDYGYRWSQHDVADALSARLADRGITMLHNDVVNVAGLHIGGVEDLWSGRMDDASVLAQLSDDRAGLILCHNPQ